MNRNRPYANLSARGFFSVVFKRKRLIGSVALGICAMALCAWLVVPTVYEAQTQILVKLGRESVYIPNWPVRDSAIPPLGTRGNELINSEVELIKSKELAERVVTELGLPMFQNQSIDLWPGSWGTLFSTKQESDLKNEAAERVRKQLVVEPVKNSRVIEIRFRHRDPQTAAQAVSHVVDGYFEKRTLLYSSPQSLTFFREQSDTLKKEINELENELKRFKETHDLSALMEEKSLLLKQKVEIQNNLNLATSQRAEMNRRIKEIGKHMVGMPASVSQGEDLESNPALINTLQARLVELELKQRELSAKYTDNNRLVQEVKNEINLVREKLSREESQRHARTRFGPNPSRLQMENDLARNQIESQATADKEKALTQHLDTCRRRLEQLNDLELKLREREQTIKIKQDNYHLYIAKLEESRIANAMDERKITSVSLVESARVPLEPVGPKLPVVMGVVLPISLFLGIAAAFLREMFNDRLESPEDCEEVFRAPVLTSLLEYHGSEARG
ncbi:MAG: GumC family protein [Deltaproteobacteria bacterium]|nr:GumC family protein [Deltaproteobacteria bacterium]